MTVSDLLVAAAPAVAETEGAGARARVHARPSVTEGDRDGITWVRRAADTAVADLRGAWLWDTRGPSPRTLWNNRIPSRDAVPGANRVLWLGWCAYNHAALLALFPLMFLFWAASHPARLLYAAPIAAPVAALWLT